jgi:PhnB protein
MDISYHTNHKEQTMQVNSYLNFKGECEEAFKFYADVVGGTIQSMIPFEGSEMAGHMPAEWGHKILHASMTVGDSVVMGSDAPSDRYTTPAGFSMSINVSDPADADRVFNALAENGKVTMPMGKTSWAERFGMLIDRYGIPWMVNCEQNQNN